MGKPVRRKVTCPVCEGRKKIGVRVRTLGKQHVVMVRCPECGGTGHVPDGGMREVRND